MPKPDSESKSEPEFDNSEPESDDFKYESDDSEFESDDSESEFDFNSVLMNLGSYISWNKFADGFWKQCKYNAYFLVYHYLKICFY